MARGGALRYGNAWISHRTRAHYADVQGLLPKFREMAVEAGRDPVSLPITIWTCATAMTASHAWW
jgi:hypothetical protein